MTLSYTFASLVTKHETLIEKATLIITELPRFLQYKLFRAYYYNSLHSSFMFILAFILVCLVQSDEGVIYLVVSRLLYRTVQYVIK